jgi:ATP-dependent helicase/nuclease subunit A
MSGLTIYRASAGSGKTYALAMDFILLVLKVPEKYQHILAVTFTNKATAEMKNRILSELNSLANSHDSDMRQQLEEESGLHGDKLNIRAKEVLDTILHNYSRFHIETIDRFFQRAIRVFTKELGLAAGYQVELDPSPVLSEAVDALIHDLDQDSELMEWVGAYARERIEDGKHWNLKRDIMDLGKEINKERFQEKGEELRKVLDDRESLKAYLKKMNRIRYSFEKRIFGYAQEAVDIMEKEIIEAEDFKGKGSGIGAYFLRWANSDFREPTATILKSFDVPEEWVVKGSQATDRMIDAYNKGLGECLKKCLKLFKEEYDIYLSSYEVKNFLPVLGILNEISNRMKRYSEEQGIFLLSDSPRFLYGIIDGNEAPFIYEKIGTYFHHYMIDEFQDTSSMQWKNFLPLIDNSLAFMRMNLVVGDVKQSIYRWRNSDWEILSEKIHRQFGEDQMDVVGLTHNWRSRENIIAFNNDFFTASMNIYSNHFSQGDNENIYSEKIRNAYADLAQEVPDIPGREDGYVHVSMPEAETTEDWRVSVHEKLIKKIEMLQEQGFQPYEIAILVRRKWEGREIADVLLNRKRQNPDSGYRYDVISNESLFLSNASSVRLILNVMRYLDNPGDRLNHAQLLFEYSRLLGNTDNLIVEEILADGITGDPVGNVIPKGFYDEAARLKYLTLTELTESIISLFTLNSLPSQVPYLLAFQDLVLDYSKNKPADINSFLEWWDENGEEKALNISEDQNAIRVMTIHKAKGLEFRAVIIPYCNWSLDHNTRFNSEVLWCTPEQGPFNQLPLIPVPYRSSLNKTIFRKDYEEEQFRVFIDHLNLLYVAMTRARDALIVFGKRSSKSSSNKLSTASNLLESILIKGTMPSCRDAILEEKNFEWTYGEINFKKKEETAGQLEQEMISQLISHKFSGKLRLKYRGMDFFDPESEKRINKGNIMHEIFSLILTHEDVDMAVDKIRREGLLDKGEAESIRKEIKQTLNIEPFRDWFSGEWEVIAEKDILNREGALKRPDRVMLQDESLIVVDYKFGHSKSPGHKQQVKQYMNTLKQMNYQDVIGYLWYVHLDELIEV